MSEKLKARVVLKEAKTYTLAGKKFVKDVPVIVKGDAVKEFMANGYFRCTLLSGSSSESDAKEPSKPASSKKLLKKKKKS